MVLLASASLLTVLEVMALSLSEDTSAGSLEQPEKNRVFLKEVQKYNHQCTWQALNQISQSKMLVETLLLNSSFPKLLCSGIFNDVF